MAGVAVAAPGRAGLAVLAMAGVNLIWGAAFPITKPALETVPTFTFTLLRFAVVLAVLLPPTWREVAALLRGPDGRRLALMGMVGFCVAQVSQAVALPLSPASDLALIATTTPLWIALLAWPCLGERLHRRSVAAFPLAIAGLAILFWPSGDTAADAGQRITGDLVFLVCGLAWAYYNVLGKGVMERHEPLPATAAAGAVGTLGLVPFAAWEWFTAPPPVFTPVAVGAILYTGLLVSVVGFSVLFWAYRQTTAARVAITMYLQPLAGVLLAWQLLGEPLGAMFLAGAAGVLAAVALVTAAPSADP